MIEASFHFLGIVKRSINEEGLQGMEEIKSVDTVIRLQVVWVKSTKFKSEPQGGTPEEILEMWRRCFRSNLPTVGIWTQSHGFIASSIWKALKPIEFNLLAA